VRDGYVADCVIVTTADGADGEAVAAGTGSTCEENVLKGLLDEDSHQDGS
jgi:hypothetical protein